MHLYSFEKLEVWQLARELTKHIYVITKSFPDEEKYGLISQIRRAQFLSLQTLQRAAAEKAPKSKPVIHKLLIHPC